MRSVLKLLITLLCIVSIWGFVIFALLTCVAFIGPPNESGENLSPFGFIPVALALLCAFCVRFSWLWLRRERERAAAAQRGFPVMLIDRPPEDEY